MKKIYIFYLIFLLIKPGTILASEELTAEKSERTSAAADTIPRKVSGVNPNLSRQFFAANEALVANKNAEAITTLKKISDHSFAQYFNLGCAYLKNNDKIEAWIAFEKARQLDPHHEALAPAFQNLSLTPRQKNFISILQTRFYMNILTILAIFFFWLGIFAWIWRRIKDNNHRAFIYNCELLSAICAGLLWWANTIKNKCIAVKNNTLVHIAPSGQSGIAEKIAKGTPLFVREKCNQFVYISMEKGKNGWVANEDVKFIVE
jgi:tetratricopeptide (TPR) repeat protein